MVVFTSKLGRDDVAATSRRPKSDQTLVPPPKIIQTQRCLTILIFISLLLSSSQLLIYQVLGNSKTYFRSGSGSSKMRRKHIKMYKKYQNLMFWSNTEKVLWSICNVETTSLRRRKSVEIYDQFSTSPRRCVPTG